MIRLRLRAPPLLQLPLRRLLSRARRGSCASFRAKKKARAGPGLSGSSGAVLLAGQQHLGLMQGLLFGGLLADEMEDVHHSPDSAPAPVA